jgi:hypothetical protein
LSKREPRTWTCSRQSDGAKCGHVNLRIYQKCRACGKRKPRRKASPKDVPNVPYEKCVEMFGNVCNWPGCEIEGTPEKKLHRDHDHDTMELRGLLCFQHNYRLRRYATWKWVRAAFVYLGTHERRMGRLPD